MSWALGCAYLADRTGRDLQRAARVLGGGEALWRASASRLAAVLRVSDADAAALVAARRSFDPAHALAEFAKAAIEHVGQDDPVFPRRLHALPDAPFGLFAGGGRLAELVDDATPVIAIVGSRRPTSFGLVFGRELASWLTLRGAVVVSGLALGIDAAAHEGALAGGGSTVAVVGAGVDVESPRRNAELRRRILAAGAVVSEYWPGTEPAPWRFPARNRIIAGLADAVVVVEAGERSGALITADFALELGRPVLAVPGSPGAAASVGCNALLRAGAAMCEHGEDVIAECPHLAWVDANDPGSQPPDGLDGEIYDLLSREPLLVDEVLERVDAGVPEVVAALGRLELRGDIVKGQTLRYWAAPLRGAA